MEKMVTGEKHMIVFAEEATTPETFRQKGCDHLQNLERSAA